MLLAFLVGYLGQVVFLIRYFVNFFVICWCTGGKFGFLFSFQMPFGGVTVKDVSSHDFVKALSVWLKK